MNILNSWFEFPRNGLSSCCFGYSYLDCNIISPRLQLRRQGWVSLHRDSFGKLSSTKNNNKCPVTGLKKAYFRIVYGPLLCSSSFMKEPRDSSTVVSCEEKEDFNSFETTIKEENRFFNSLQLETLQVRTRKEDTNCRQQVILNDSGVFQDFDNLELLNRRNSVFSLKAISLSEKLVVVFADLISDYLVLDMLGRITSPYQAVEFVLGTLVAYFLADLFSGLFNWASANYLSDSFRWFRNALRYYQWHVERPEEIVQMNFFDNVYSHCLIVIPFLLLTAYLRNGLSLFLEAVVVFLLACIAIWPELHKWSHMEDSNKPPPVIVRTLQQLGVILNADDHKEYHDSQLVHQVESNPKRLPPSKFYVASVSYSTVSGHWNWLLDSIEFYRKLEYLIYLLTGVEPRIWSQDPKLRKRFITKDNARKT